jgi:outer membrane protein assembly factor BamB
MIRETKRKLLVGMLCLAALLSGRLAQAYSGLDILKVADVKGGLVVHLGCGDGTLTADLLVNERYLVHGLDTDRKNVERARQHIQSRGQYGKVSVDIYDGEHLPYVDNVVNLVVVSRPNPSRSVCKVSRAELLRVLCPHGVALIEIEGNEKLLSSISRSPSDRADGFVRFTKPWPRDIDQWTHYLHDADNNAVANDTVVGPPKGMQWADYPLWSRGHSTLSGTSSMVSSNGRLFSIEDLAPAVLPTMPGKYTLVARDAFNGIVLWKHPFSDWENVTHHMKGSQVQLPRRLVAIDDRVYVTPGISAPVVSLDAADGTKLRSYEGTERTQEILCYREVLYLVVGDETPTVGYPSEKSRYPHPMAYGAHRYNPRRMRDVPRKCSILALEAATGRKLWEKSGEDLEGYEGTILAVRDDKVVYQAAGSLICLDRLTGKEIWRKPFESTLSKRTLKLAGGSPTLVMTSEAVYCADVGVLRAFTLKDGRELWKKTSDVRFGYHSSPDLFVANGAIWVQNSQDGYDLRTGAAIQSRGQSRTGPMGHDRCYRNKATLRFLVESKSGGADFSTFGNSDSLSHPWVRGTCSLGILPCNGLLYASPHACSCSNETVLNGFWSLTSQDRFMASEGGEPASEKQLEKGPAYGLASQHDPDAKDNPWPTYRQNTAREGAGKTDLSADLRRVWKVRLSGKPTPPVIADGKVLLAAEDTHVLYALDDDSGRILWTFTAGGRIDTPPTYHKGLLLFGSRDGWVYCVRAADGTLIWRFRAAPQDRSTCAFGQLESLWPVHGSVLVLNDVAYVAAGRSTFLDGGIFMYGLDPVTGRKLYEKILSGPHEKGTGEPIINATRHTSIHGNKNDVLVTDGEYIYLSHMAFRPDLTPVEDRSKNRDHLLSASNLLDDACHHRSFWTVAAVVPFDNNMSKLAVPDGDMLAIDGEKVYGFRAHPAARDARKKFDPLTEGHALFAMTRGEVLAPVYTRTRRGAVTQKAIPTVSHHRYDTDWAVFVGVSGQSITIDKERIFVAGKLHAFPEDDIFKAVEGRMGGLLIVASRDDGNELARYALDAVPVWDGMAAANGRLILCLRDGSVICWGPK